MKRVVSGTLVLIMLQSSIVHAVPRDNVISNEIIDENIQSQENSANIIESEEEKINNKKEDSELTNSIDEINSEKENDEQVNNEKVNTNGAIDNNKEESNEKTANSNKEENNIATNNKEEIKNNQVIDTNNSIKETTNTVNSTEVEESNINNKEKTNEVVSSSNIEINLSQEEKSNKANVNNTVIDVKNNTEVLDENGKAINLVGDGVTDETDKIEKLISYAISNGRELYFPKGTYKITRDIDLSKVKLPNLASFKITGDTNGLTVFDGTSSTEKMLRLVHSGYSGEIDTVEISNIVFNNMGVEISQKSKKNVVIKDNVFINGNYTREKNSDGSIAKVTMEPYIVAKNTSYTIENNIFLRGENYPGRGIATYGSKDSTITNNFFGDLDGIDNAEKMLPKDVINKLVTIKNSGLVQGNQGNFFTGINNERYDTNVTITNNYFDMMETRNVVGDFPENTAINGINVESEGQRRDHIIYSKCYDNLNIVGNYFKGMENDGAGGIKVRNGKNAYIGSNYFNNVPLLTYIYGDLTRADSILYNTVIYNNLFHTKSNFGGKDTGILYYQNFKDGQTLEFNVKNSDGTVTKDVWENAYGDVQNYIIYKNSFLSDERDLITISGRATTAFNKGEFLSYGNTYMELSKPVNYNTSGNLAIPEASEDVILSNMTNSYYLYKDVKIPLTPPTVDKSYLEAKLAEANSFYYELLNNNLIGSLGGQYPEEATEEFKKILDEVNKFINSGNLTQAEVNKNLTLVTDALEKLKDSINPIGEVPVVLNAPDIKVNKGDSIDFMENLNIIDNKDTIDKLDIKVDSGDFSNLIPGTYTIKYTVTDTDGNVTTFTRNVEVLEESEEATPGENESTQNGDSSDKNNSEENSNLQDDKESNDESNLEGSSGNNTSNTDNSNNISNKNNDESSNSKLDNSISDNDQSNNKTLEENTLNDDKSNNSITEENNKNSITNENPQSGNQFSNEITSNSNDSNLKDNTVNNSDENAINNEMLEDKLESELNINKCNVSVGKYAVGVAILALLLSVIKRKMDK